MSNLNKWLGKLLQITSFVLIFCILADLIVPSLVFESVHAQIVSWSDDTFDVYWVKSSQYYKGVPENGMSLHVKVKNDGLFYKLSTKQLWLKFLSLVQPTSIGPVLYWDSRFHDNTYYSMMNQFYCHAVGRIRAGDNWNLEVWRPNVGFTRTLLSGCNPT